MKRGAYRVVRDGVLTSAQEPPAGAVAIHLTHGAVAWVDSEDAAMVQRHNWHAVLHGTATQHWYATSNTGGKMHRLILGAAPGSVVDHRKHFASALKVIDNRKANLRFCSRQQNNQNCRSRQGCASIFKGVSRRGDRWRAYVRVGGKLTSLGTFRDEGHAAYAYDLAALKHYGEFALTNFEGYP